MPNPGVVNPDAWVNQSGGVTLRHNVDLVSNLTIARAREIAAALTAAAADAERIHGRRMASCGMCGSILEFDGRDERNEWLADHDPNHLDYVAFYSEAP